MLIISIDDSLTDVSGNDLFQLKQFSYLQHQFDSEQKSACCLRPLVFLSSLCSRIRDPRFFLRCCSNHDLKVLRQT